MAMNRPQRRSRMPGSTSRAKYTVLIRFRLNAATIATRSFSPRSTSAGPLTASQIFILSREPVSANGTEDVQIHRVFDRHCAVRDIRRDVQHFAFPHQHRPALELELQRSFQDVSDLLAFVLVRGNDTAFGDED